MLMIKSKFHGETCFCYSKPMEELEDFLRQYEAATNSHIFDNVQPLLATNAVYWFSDGSFEGYAAIRDAFEKTWATVKNEVYRIVGVRWVVRSDTIATCIYEFRWEGDISRIKRTGIGRGTNVMSRVGSNWRMVHEHLSKSPS